MLGEKRTSLGEESAEAVVGLSLLALLGQVTIGLVAKKSSLSIKFISRSDGITRNPIVIDMFLIDFTYLDTVLQTVQL